MQWERKGIFLRAIALSNLEAWEILNDDYTNLWESCEARLP